MATPSSSTSSVTAAHGSLPQHYVWTHALEYDSVTEYKVRVHDQKRAHIHLGAYLQMAIQTRVPTVVIRLPRVLINTGVLETRIIVDKLSHIPLISIDADKLIDAESCECWETHQRMAKKFSVEDNDKPHATYEERMRSSAPLVEQEPGCSKCSVKFILSVRNDAPEEQGLAGEVRQVTCRDLQRVPFHGTTELTFPSIQPVPVLPYADPIPICKLRRGQQFHAVLYAKRGCGQKPSNSKYTPSTTLAAWYPNRVQLSYSELAKCTPDEKDALAKSCPEGLISYDRVDDRVRLHNDTRNCTACQVCNIWATRNKKPNLVSFTEDRANLSIDIGLTRALPGKTILMQAFDAVDDMLREVDMQILEAP